ncbi:MAG: endonuclease III [Alphaproteobacteria bacterium]|nr:endonuclease III [Alphaproteobacteria bacterium]MBN2779621.1 endonuclease III [Alphaproteobacteria bacterium]
MTQLKRITALFETLQKGNPNPKSELDYINEFTFAVAVILSAQSTDKGVNKATPALFKVAKTPQDVLKLGYDGLEPYLKTIGLFRNKTKSILKMSQTLVDKFDGKLPRDRKSLTSLGGIGDKTASVIRNELWGEHDIAVDTHVYRLAHRLNLVSASANTADKVAALLPTIVPKQFHAHTSDWLVLHGRYICTAKKPKCDQCPIAQHCPSVQIRKTK